MEGPQPTGLARHPHPLVCFQHIVRHCSFHMLAKRNCGLHYLVLTAGSLIKWTSGFERSLYWNHILKLILIIRIQMNKKWQSWHFSFPYYELISNHIKLKKMTICLNFDIINNKHKNKANLKPGLWIRNCWVKIFIEHETFNYIVLIKILLYFYWEQSKIVPLRTKVII